MQLYIHGYGLLSAAGSSSDAGFLQEEPVYETDQLLCKEPDYTSYIPPMQLRRMSKAVRMGIGASKLSMQLASLEKPDAISLGTAMGCLQDTEVFLSKMIDQEEQMLTPTAFIQSTHNTVAGQIALLAGCHGHNLTYVHRGHSFEHALMNAQLYLNDHPDERMLVGGIDELIPASKHIMQRLGIYSSTPLTAQEILNNEADGSVAGEGASFFVLSTTPSSIIIRNISPFFAAKEDAAVNQLSAIAAQYASEEIDAVVLGMNGNRKCAPFYEAIRKQLFPASSHIAFKHLSGDYATAGTFGLGLICHAKQNGFPAQTILNRQPERLKKILLINHFGQYYSCLFIELI